MGNWLNVTRILKKGNLIEYDYEAEGKWKELLKLEKKMFVEYDINIESVPDSIAIVPLLCNILPISWVFDLKIRISTIDQEFYECIPELKKGYSHMYPNIEMLGEMETGDITKNNYAPIENATLFSGGVDAFNTLFKHIEEKPTLTTIWGADVTLEDKEGWENVKKLTKSVASTYGLNSSFIKSNFRGFLNYINLWQGIHKKVKGEWWHEFQHGIGILGLVAPIAYINKYKNLYIASSFTIEDKGKTTCASDPTIDNYLKVANCKVVHDGYEYNRQDKLHNICEYMKQKQINEIQLRVCWESSGGENCCQCEKCYRTILGIISEKQNPKNYGLNITEEQRKRMMRELPRIAKYNPWRQYKCIQKRFIENYSLEETPKDLVWFRKLKIYETKPNYVIIYEKVLKKIKRNINKIFKK